MSYRPIDECPDFEYRGCRFLTDDPIYSTGVPDGVTITFSECVLPTGLSNGAYRVVNGRLKRLAFLSLWLKVYQPVRDWMDRRRIAKGVPVSLDKLDAMTRNRWWKT